MSLINDALKKAQRERSGSPTPPATVPPTPGAPHAYPAARAKSNPWPIVLVVLALIGGGAAVWFLKPSPSAPATVAANTPSPAPPPARGEPSPATTAPTEQPPALQINLPNSATPPAANTPAPVATTPAPAPAVASSPAPIPAAPPASEPTATPSFKVTLQMEDPRVLAFLDAARINGVRSVADDAKLLMNSKVFRAGAVVDRELGLKLVQILPTELVFEDSHGIQYRKSL
jgi:hypothetical protein